ncbi:MAG: B12-binding domain-containing radical SAM protein [Ignavibacteria bacterium]|nr:B12-binding domain-containing radical SAM protein [Ignavibacteria bacterium]
MDVLLAHAYSLDEDPAEQRVMKPYAPLGILSISAHLKERGCSVGVFDPTFQTIDSFERELARLRPPVVGISINMMTKRSAIRMIRMAAAAGCRVVVGGPEPSSYAEEYLDEGADVVAIGEGERTMEELLAVWGCASVAVPDGGMPASLHDVAGIVFRDTDGAVVRTAAREKLRTLDELPFPDRGAIDFTPYFKAWKERHGVTSLSIITQRGCPYTCAWCSHSVYGESYRRRAPARVAEEIEAMKRAYNPDMLWFVDDVFTISAKWIFELQEELLRRDLHIPFECITRADRLNDDIIAALKAMGCRRVWIGAESGSQRILDAMSRGVTVRQVETMTHACRAAGIEVGTFIMLGYLGETASDIRATAAYLRRSRPDIVLTTVSYPIKGTAYYDALGPAAVVPAAPFEQWTDRNIAVRGRYSDRFYWYANRYIIHSAAAGRSLADGRYLRAVPSLVKSAVAQAGMALHGRSGEWGVGSRE